MSTKPTFEALVKEKKAKARNEAQSELNRRHAAELRELLVEAHDRYGVDYKPRLTPQERAEREVQRIVAEFPQVLDQFAPDKGQPEKGADE